MKQEVLRLFHEFPQRVLLLLQNTLQLSEHQMFALQAKSSTVEILEGIDKV